MRMTFTVETEVTIEKIKKLLKERDKIEHRIEQQELADSVIGDEHDKYLSISATLDLCLNTAQLEALLS